jgi:hypothetical protein
VPAVVPVLLLLALAAVAMPLRQRLAFFALQPLLDASYTLGLTQGLLRLALPGRKGRIG